MNEILHNLEITFYENKKPDQKVKARCDILFENTSLNTKGWKIIVADKGIQDYILRPPSVSFNKGWVNIVYFENTEIFSDIEEYVINEYREWLNKEQRKACG